MKQKTLSYNYDEIHIPNGALILTAPLKKETPLDVYLIPEILPVDLQLQLDFLGDHLRIQTFGNTQLTWFDADGNSSTQQCRIQEQNLPVDYYFMAKPLTGGLPIIIKLHLITVSRDWVFIFLSRH